MTVEIHYCTVCYTINTSTQLDVDDIDHLAPFAPGKPSGVAKYPIKFGSILRRWNPRATSEWDKIQ